MQLFGSRTGTAVWLLIAFGTAALAVFRDDPLTGVIALGWFVLAVFSYVAYARSA